MRPSRVAAIGMLWSGSVPALAIDASDYLYVPAVTQGEREIDLYLGSGSTGPQIRSENNAGVGFGAGVSEHWFTELTVQYRKKQFAPAGLDALEWENIVQFGQTGQLPVDFGMVFTIERPFNPNSDPIKKDSPSIRFGPLLQKEYGRFQGNLNFIFVRHFQTTDNSPVQFRYQFQIKYRYREPLEFGVQSFGQMGTGTQTVSGYTNEVHRIGPAVLGHFAIPGERSLSYNAALLIGTTSHSPDRTLRIQIEYEF